MKLVIKFMKLGRMAYISHLDLQRAMLRGLRSVGLTPLYSQGFNPHPKLSLALPLSLGFESLCEYLEVEIEENAHTHAALSGVARFGGEDMVQALAGDGLNRAQARVENKGSTAQARVENEGSTAQSRVADEGNTAQARVENDFMKNAAVIEILNDALPDGIIVTGTGIIAEYAASGSAGSPKQHSLASKVKYAAYDVTAPFITRKCTSADAPEATARENASADTPEATARENASADTPETTARENASADTPETTACENASADTILTVAHKNASADTAAELIKSYMAQEHIFVEKENKKKDRVDTIDIRPMIHSFSAERNVGEKARYKCVVSASGGTVLNPLLLIQSYYSFAGDSVDTPELTVVRTDILF
ncbi:MAG: TIGR03936 family radical SAM-associated protein [Clostridiales Family XIII bacterium]|jgi:uncharacterized protein (DUF2344 family)|nr:TIGR03936 family radical SAM-associated protein [Clostridiales Family XIII bacterium]